MIDRRSRQIQRMFGSIAHRYDLLNRLLSFSIDRYWRHRTLKKLEAAVTGPQEVLDLCTGTGDLAFKLEPLGRVIGCDFCHAMLVRGIAKKRSRRGGVGFVEGDALQLPFSSAAFDIVSIAFGFRNLENYQLGLQEMFRVLKPGGYLAVLEFSIPRAPAFRQLYLFYFTRILPRIGRLISGQKGPYSYLPASVKEFPAPKRLSEKMREAGFCRTDAFPMSGGIATLLLAQK